MRIKLSRQHGFTLIELMIVVVIIGILAAMAIGRYSQSAIRAKQGEAQLVLKQICTNQMLYRAESPANSYYSTGATANAGNPLAFASIDVEIASNARYDYTLQLAGNDFVATATANLDGDALDDVWTISSDGDLTCVQNDATN